MTRVMKRETRDGVIYSLDEGRGFVHPWYVSVWPTGTKKGGEKWACSVEPGFVNGIDPRVPAAEADKAALQELQKDGSGKEVVLGLSDRPEIPIREFSLERKPLPYFMERGVREEKSGIVTITLGGGVKWDQTNAADTGPKRRWLQKSVVYIARSRPTYQMHTEIGGSLVTGQVIDYTVSIDTRAMELHGSRARLYTAGSMPEKYVPTIADRLAGVYGDDGEDRVQLATIFFLSPEGFKPPDDPKEPMPEPDENWTPYVKHQTYWNLSVASKNLPPINVKQSPTNPFLAYFVGRYSTPAMGMEGIAGAEGQRLLQAAWNSSNNEGRFWTV